MRKKLPEAHAGRAENPPGELCRAAGGPYRVPPDNHGFVGDVVERCSGLEDAPAVEDDLQFPRRVGPAGRMDISRPPGGGKKGAEADLEGLPPASPRIAGGPSGAWRTRSRSRDLVRIPEGAKDS